MGVAEIVLESLLLGIGCSSTLILCAMSVNDLTCLATMPVPLDLLLFLGVLLTGASIAFRLGVTGERWAPTVLPDRGDDTGESIAVGEV